ncbi:hypothetical protein F4859DRAFT_475673 [Xylaria cf. heliscus]|nr:hypothetical protein F4859DRAFT_475673 [Xylaria cf. heliscus]
MAASNSLGPNGSNNLNIIPTSHAGSKWEQALQRLRKEDQERFNAVNRSSDEPRKVLDDVLAAANERKEECLKKRWRLVINGRTIYIRDVLEKLSVWAKKLVAIGDIAIQYDPVHAALPWAAVRLVLQTGINDLETFGHVIISLENLASIIAQCHIIETVYPGRRKPKTPELASQLTESIVNLYTAILQYLADIIKYFTLSTGERIFKSIGHSQEDLQVKYSPVKHALEDFGRLAGLAQAANLDYGLDLIESIDKQLEDRNARNESEPEWLKRTIEQLRQPIDRIDIRLQEMDDGLKQENRAEILRAVSNIPHGSHHKVASNGRVEGSGAWFLSTPKFKEWRLSSSPSTLWLHGIPGSGKTKLTSIVIDQLLRHEHVAYFYCMRNPAEPQRGQSDRILGSLVRQLASVGPRRRILGPVMKYYEAAIERDEDLKDLALTTDESVELLLELFDEYPAVTLVLDALDEVNQECRQELLDALDTLVQKSNSLVRIFVSSRDNYDITLSLSGAPNIYIGAKDNAEDISSFIDKKLTEAKLLHGNLPPSLRTAIVNTLRDGAKGMFRWVDLQIQSLRPLKVAADVRARLGVLPTTLEASYWEIYQQTIDSGDNALKLATLTCQWLLYATEPISLNGFAALASVALVTEPDTIYTAAEVLDVCSNLIVERESSFEFAHLSVREFFERLNNRQIYTYQPEEGHAALAQACLQYLNQAQAPGEAIRERIMYSKRFGIDCGVKTDRNGQEDSIEVGTQFPPGYWAHVDDPEDLNIPRLTEVIWTGISPGVPSQYVVDWMVYHVDAAGSIRLRPALSDLLKAFILQPAEPTREARSGRTTLSYMVAPSFHVWYHLAQKTSWKHREQYPITLRTDHASPIWLACEMQWFELVEYLYQNPYNTIDAAICVGGRLDVEFNPFWYAMRTRRTELANCIAACTTNKSRTFSVNAGFMASLEAAVEEADEEFVKELANLYLGDYEGATKVFIEVAFLGHHEAMRLIIEPPSTSTERVLRP